MSLLVEVCVEGLSSALAASLGGADRIELCSHLAVGGITSSAGLIAQACRLQAKPIHVLIRPRGGSFHYTDAEFESMFIDIDTARQQGASGVVIGVLNPDRTINLDRTARLVEAARPLSVTFHRAFDEVPDPLAALETLQSLGIDRILTSGCAPTAREGLETLSRLVRLAGRSPIILPAGQIRPDDLPSLASIGLTECHVGSAVQRDGLTDPDLVHQFVKIAHGLP